MGRLSRPRPSSLEFGRRVRERRHALGLSQLAFADVVGLHFTYISDVELGRRNVTLETILRLAAALEVDAAELVTGLQPADPTLRPDR
jgi:transcriptional regulator with XRE-family HTH domain